MLKIMTISNPERFLSVIDHSRGDVFLRLPNHSHADLKRNPAVRQMLSCMEISPAGLQIELTDHSDTVLFLEYLAQSGFES